MTKFGECKKEWLEINQEEKILLTKVKNKIGIVSKQQNEMGNYFRFPHYETINKVKRHHWFFSRTETEEKLKCPCCNFINVVQYKIRIPSSDYYIISECSTCGYFSIEFKIPSYTHHLYIFNFHSLQYLNSQLDRYLNKVNEN